LVIEWSPGGRARRFTADETGQQPPISSERRDDGGERKAHRDVGEQRGQEVAPDRLPYVSTPNRPNLGAIGGGVIMKFHVGLPWQNRIGVQLPGTPCPREDDAQFRPACPLDSRVDPRVGKTAS
jgi:hypothetical protein